MNRAIRPIVLAVLTAALVLNSVSCSRVGNANDAADALIAITLVTYDGQSVAATTKDVTVTIQFDVVKKNNSTVFPPDPNLNAVSFSSGTVTFDPPLTAFSGPVVTPNVSFPLGSTGNKMIVDVMTEPNKVALGAGTVVSGFLHFDGSDLNGRPVDLDTPFITALTP